MKRFTVYFLLLYPHEFKSPTDMDVAAIQVSPNKKNKFLMPTIVFVFTVKLFTILSVIKLIKNIYLQKFVILVVRI